MKFEEPQQEDDSERHNDSGNLKDVSSENNIEVQSPKKNL
jgi:hypothetical protein